MTLPKIDDMFWERPQKQEQEAETRSNPAQNIYPLRAAKIFTENPIFRVTHKLQFIMFELNSFIVLSVYISIKILITTTS